MSTDITMAETYTPEKPATSSRSWLQFLGICLLGVFIFGCGMIVGAAGTVKFIEKKLKAHLAHPEETPDRIMPVITKHLKLTPEQTSKIEPVIRKHHTELMQIRREISPRIAQEFRAIEDDVNAILDERQQKLWHGWFDKVRWFWLPRVEELNHKQPKQN